MRLTTRRDRVKEVREKRKEERENGWGGGGEDLYKCFKRLAQDKQRTWIFDFVGRFLHDAPEHLHVVALL
jgi:hypothetical protein